MRCGPSAPSGGRSTTCPEAADDFVLAAGQTTIRDIHWSGEDDGGVPATDTFTANIYSDASGSPGALVAALTFGPISRVDSGVNADIFNFSATVSPISLTAGTTYWLSILDRNDAVEWLWVDNGTTGILVSG
jgi:hypothetical protein